VCVQIEVEWDVCVFKLKGVCIGNEISAINFLK